jgi:recombination protein RecT
MSEAQKPDEPRAVLRTQLVRMSGEFKMALPNHISPDKFQRTVMTAVQQNPDLMGADRRSLLMAATKCATDGLLPDGREAAFVIFNTKVKIKRQRPDGSETTAEEWAKLVQYMPMRGGIQKRAYNTGRVTSLQGHIIYENDHFVWHQGTDEKLEHKPLFPGDRGLPIGAYAVAHIKDEERPLFRVMDKNRIEKARAVSRAKNGPAWTEWWDEMAIKTVLRNLAKDLPAASEIEELSRRDDEAPEVGESTATIDGVLTDDQRALAAPGKLDALEGAIIDGEDMET